MTLSIPRDERPFFVARNPLLPPKVIQDLQTLCPSCQIYDHSSSCSALGIVRNVEYLVRRCAGQPIIATKPGLALTIPMTETEVNSLFVEVIEAQLCIKVDSSSARSLVFPKLQRWRSCAHNKPGLLITNNPDLTTLKFPSCRSQCLHMAVIKTNPLLPKLQIDRIRHVSYGSIVEYEPPACGLTGRYTVEDFVKACAGKKMIKQHPNVPIVIDSSKVTEHMLNKLCSHATFMEVCIVIKDSTFKSLRCPHLQYIRPCQKGRPVFEIVDNVDLIDVEISPRVKYPEGENVIVVKGNTRLPPRAINNLKKICPYCEIISDFSRCSNLGQIRSVHEFLERCSGESAIIGTPGTTLDYNFTEIQINRLFSGAKVVRLCLVLQMTDITRLIFPNLRRWKSCSPGKAMVCKNARIWNNKLWLQLSHR
ncbi:hypothetical protein COOONC_11364 [Cooperia oncophora]